MAKWFLHTRHQNPFLLVDLGQCPFLLVDLRLSLFTLAGFTQSLFLLAGFGQSSFPLAGFTPSLFQLAGFGQSSFPLAGFTQSLFLLAVFGQQLLPIGRQSECFDYWWLMVYKEEISLNFFSLKSSGPEPGHYPALLPQQQSSGGYYSAAYSTAHTANAAKTGSRAACKQLITCDCSQDFCIFKIPKPKRVKIWNIFVLLKFDKFTSALVII